MVLTLNNNKLIVEKLIEEYSDFFSLDVQDKAKKFINAEQVQEVYVEPGRISSRVSIDKRTSVRVVVVLPEVVSDIWDQIIKAAATDQNILLYLYNNILPDGFFNKIPEAQKLFMKFSDATCIIDDQPSDTNNEFVASVFEKFVEQVLSFPLIFLTFRGYGAEQFIHDIRSMRSFLLQQNVLLPDSDPKGIKKNSVIISDQEFYGEFEKDNIDVLVRADELPASLLKRLDSLPPVMGLDYLDRNLEMAYERITRLAQSLARFI